jgi:hypothetical protein
LTLAALNVIKVKGVNQRRLADFYPLSTYVLTMLLWWLLVATCGYYHLQAGRISGYDLDVVPSLGFG